MGNSNLLGYTVGAEIAVQDQQAGTLGEGCLAGLRM